MLAEELLATGLQVHPHLARCEDCTLNDCPIVEGFGPETSDIVIVGEAPGYHEMVKGRPFVGRSGELLNKILTEAGISREQIYVCNSVCCRPEDNRTPTAAEIYACNERLVHEVLSKKPRVILGLGAASLRALTVDKTKITQERGSTIQWHPPKFEHDGKKEKRVAGKETSIILVPSYHPAAVLRNPALFNDLRNDVLLVKNILVGAVAPQHTSVTYEVMYSAKSFKHWAQEQRPDLVSLDVETDSSGGLLCIGIQPIASPTVIMLAKGCVQDPSFIHIWNEYAKRNTFLGHNLKFDAKVMHAHKLMCSIDHDSMLVSYACDESIGHHGLKELAKELLHIEDYDDAVKPFMSHLQDVEDKILFDYNAKDVAYTTQLYKALTARGQFGDDERRVYQDLLIPGSRVLAKMEELGVLIDRDGLDKLAEQLSSDYETARAMILELAEPEIPYIEAGLNNDRPAKSKKPLAKFNPGSNQQIAQLLFDDPPSGFGLPMPDKISTDEKTLVTLQNFANDSGRENWLRASRLIEAVLEQRHTQKLQGTYINGLRRGLDSEGRIHGTFNVHTTVTGRLSSRDPNLQNIPSRRGKEIKNIFMATPGYKLIEADLSAAEMRVLACFSKDEALVSAITSGIDLHRAMAAMVFDKKPEDITDYERFLGKTCGFATLYGSGPSKIAVLAKVSIDEAQDVQKRWFAAFPQVTDWINETKAWTLKHGYVSTPFGRKRRFGFIPPYGKEREEILRQCVNAPIQAVASDIVLSALIRIGNLIDWTTTRLLLTVHDSILLETTADPRQVGKWVEEEMTRTPFDTVPFAADVKVGTRWGSLEKLEM